MKSFLKIVLSLGAPVCLGLTFSLAAHSQNGKSSSLEARVTSALVSSNWSDLQGIQGGTLQIDLNNKEVTLTLVPRGSCAKNTLCTQSPVTVRLPVVETRDDICGIRVIEAQRDRRAVDAPLETLLVEDNAKYNCATNVERPKTRITYTEEGGWSPSIYTATFDAEVLK